MRTIANMAIAAVVLTFLAGCTAGLTAFNKAEKLEEEGKLDEAVMKFAEAASTNPQQTEYRMRLLKASEKAAFEHLKKGDTAYEQQLLDEALREYQAAVSLNPALARAKQRSDELIRVRNSLTYYREGLEFEKSNKPREALQAYRKALDLNPENKEIKEALEKLLQTRRTKLEGFELNLKSTKPITLKFKEAKLKDVFYILSQLSGINFIFDEGVKEQNVTILLENASFNQAFDLLTSMNKLGRKVLNEGTILIFPKTPEKAKQYEDLMVKTFYLNSLDAKKAVNLLRTMLQVKKIYVNEELNALVIRDNPELIDVAGKILEANDVPDAEVLLEVEVIQVSKNNSELFGLGLSRYAVSLNARTPGSGGDFFSDTFDPKVTTTSNDTTTVTTTQVKNLLNLFNWNGYQGFLTVPSATYNFSKQLSNAEVLSNPKIRVKNREKSKFTVGTRVPITTTSSTGSVGGVTVNVQYVDVGVKLNAEPVIQLNNEVTIKLGVEVSSIIGEKTVGSGDAISSVVTIGTRNVDTVLNLKDGETSIIGGLIEDSKSKSKQKIWLLGDIPLIGSLLSSHNDKYDKSELVLAITPRIVRAVSVPEADVAAFWSGKEDDPTAVRPFSSFELEPEFAVQPAATPAAKGAPAAPAAKPGPATPAGQPAAPAAPPAAGGQPAGTPATPVAASTAVGAQAVAAPVQPTMRGSLNIAAPAGVDLGGQFKVEVKVSDVKGLAKAPFILLYDPIFIEYVGAAEGNFLNRDGKPTTFNALADKAAGRVVVTMDRSAAGEGVDGSGTLLTATFTAKNKGPASLGLQNVKFVDQANRPLDIIPYNTVVEVK